MTEKMSFQYRAAALIRFATPLLRPFNLYHFGWMIRMVSVVIWVVIVISAAVEATESTAGITCVTVEERIAFEDGEEAGAKATALRAALEKAVATTHAIDEWGETLWMYQLSCNWQIPIPYVTVEPGAIIDERVIARGTEKRSAYIKLKACIKEEMPLKTKSFRLTAYLNRTAFIAGQEKVLTIKTTNDCFIYVYEVLDDTAMMIIPAADFIRDKKENRIAAFGEPFVFPSESFVKYVAPIPPSGKENVDVLIVILALKQPSDAYRFDTGNAVVVPIKVLIRAIMTIPVSERIVVAVPYSVKK